MVLKGGAASHVGKVLRLRQGDPLVVFDGSGLEYPARIEDFTRGQVTISVGAGRDPETESPIVVALLQGICRNPRMDLLIQKSTELGVTSIRPLSCERSVVRLDDVRGRKRIDHWQQVAVGACEQSGRVRVPDIARPATLSDALAGIGDDGGACLMLDPLADRTLGAVLGAAPGALRRVTLLIGPEGGLSAGERATAIDGQFRPVRLGPRILRTETASLVALSILQYLGGDLSR